MSSKEIRELLKKSIDELPSSDVRLAAKDLNLYFTYLQARKEMPEKKKLDFAEFLQPAFNRTGRRREINFCFRNF